MEIKKDIDDNDMAIVSEKEFVDNQKYLYDNDIHKIKITSSGIILNYATLKDNTKFKTVTADNPDINYSPSDNNRKFYFNYNGNAKEFMIKINKMIKRYDSMKVLILNKEENYACKNYNYFGKYDFNKYRLFRPFIFYEESSESLYMARLNEDKLDLDKGNIFPDYDNLDFIFITKIGDDIMGAMHYSYYFVLDYLLSLFFDYEFNYNTSSISYSDNNKNDYIYYISDDYLYSDQNNQDVKIGAILEYNEYPCNIVKGIGDHEYIMYEIFNNDKKYNFKSGSLNLLDFIYKIKELDIVTKYRH